MMGERQPTSYDEVPYTSHAFYEAHPDRMAVIATLYGMSPPPVERCRVLELGCGLGGNLIPMAVGLPDARFVGVDLSVTEQSAIEVDGDQTLIRCHLPSWKRR